ncbi:uncharacterized protein BXZ73DRAFT_98543 [Epithele typhae]|uniref:uncharacterized protein n=1 Tax=Epithele typhae TaxID=378194 RepID=UPI0020081DF6|nr:uncharacterized protein BXZ73DRAFT_98543 [Epithele typhae]KAH9940715.1 hypothetical protein BXZ73DRAFT_98543 [Epithele typhae]
MLEDMLKWGLGVLEGVSAGMYSRLRGFVRDNTEFIIKPAPSPVPDAPKPLPSATSAFIPRCPAPDAIVVCSDDVRFDVHKLMIALHMPRLAAQPAPNDQPRVEPPLLPLYRIDAPSASFFDVLGIAYQEADIDSWDLDRLLPVMATIRKYGMERISRTMFPMWKKAAATSPLHAYFAALQHGLSDTDIRAAARATLTLSNIDDAYDKSMEDVTASAYHHLLRYHSDVAQSVQRSLLPIETNWKDGVHSFFPKSIYATDAHSFCNAVLGWLPPKLKSSVSPVGPAQIKSSFTVSAMLQDASFPQWITYISAPPTRAQFISTLQMVEDTLPGKVDEGTEKVALVI